MAATLRQLNKVPAFDAERMRLERLLQHPAGIKGRTWDHVVKALSRYDHHRASIYAPSRDTDVAREGRFHVAWMRIALRQAAKLLGVPNGV